MFNRICLFIFVMILIGLSFANKITLYQLIVAILLCWIYESILNIEDNTNKE